MKYILKKCERAVANASIIRSFIDFIKSCFKDLESKNIFTELDKRIQFCLDLYEKFHSLPTLAGVTLRDFTNEIIDSVYRIYNTNRQNVIFSRNADSLYIDVKWILPIGFIVNELISNAFIHAYRASSGNVYISANKSNGTLILSVKDEGKTNWNYNQSKKGIGLSLVSKIVEEINADFTIVCNGGTEVRLQLKVNDDEKISEQI